MKKVIKNVDEYIAEMPKETRDFVIRLRLVLKKAAPQATERISYGMPFYEYGGSGFKGRLVYFDVLKKYIAVYIPPAKTGESLDKLKKYQVTKSSFHFSLDKLFPFALVGKVIQKIVKRIDHQDNSK